MIKNLKNKLSLLTILALLFSVGSLQAGIATYSFSGSFDYNQGTGNPPAIVPVSGGFSLDESLLPGGTGTLTWDSPDFWNGTAGATYWAQTTNYLWDSSETAGGSNITLDNWNVVSFFFLSDQTSTGLTRHMQIRWPDTFMRTGDFSGNDFTLEYTDNFGQEWYGYIDGVNGQGSSVPVLPTALLCGIGLLGIARLRRA